MKSFTLKDKSGFTMLELMIAIAIVAILVTFVSHQAVKTWQKERLKSSVNQIRSFFSDAHKEAMKATHDVLFHVDSDSITMKVVAWSDTNSSFTIRENKLEFPGATFTVTTDRNEDGKIAEKTMTFDAPDGNASKQVSVNYNFYLRFMLLRHDNNGSELEQKLHLKIEASDFTHEGELWVSGVYKIKD